MRRAVSRIIPSHKTDKSSTNNNNNNGNNANNSNNSYNGNYSANSNANSSNNASNFNASGGFISSLKMDFTSVQDFFIQLDNPHKPWLPGDEVSGQIILVSKKNLANIVVTLSLLGFVKINASSHSKLRPLKHTLFNHTIKIYGDLSLCSSPQSDDFTNGLFKGEHRFPFIVKLPNKRIFTSIDFGKGSINYTLRASIGNSSSYTSTPSPSNTLISSPSASSSPSEHPTPPGNHLFSKIKNPKVLHNPSYSAEKTINLVSPIDVTTLPAPKPKRLIIRDPRNSGGKRLSRTQSSTSTINTINTFATFSSNNSDTLANTNANTTLTNTNNNTTLTNTNNNSTNNTHNPHNIHNPSTNSINNIHNTNSINPSINSNTHNSTNINPSINPTNSTNTNTNTPETIKVALEIPQRGYLRGELIPLKISINHLKKVQDLNGIIVTFVRVCRLDNGPDGLFESFRKDLQQLVIPLYVDPVTFQADITSSVRVPADAFPTIVGCPLVSFQYFVEVLINLLGKSLALENEELHASHLKHLASFDEDAPENSEPFNFNFSYKSTLSSLHHQKDRLGYINTDKFKRLKKFLQLTTEIIIGTHRSSPSGNHQPETPTNQQNVQNTNNSPNIQNIQNNPTLPSVNLPPNPSELSPITNPPILSNSLNVPVNSTSSLTPPYVAETDSPASNFNIPIYEEVGMAHTLTEKDRMRLHESSLLPSAPPEIDDEDDVVSPVNDNMLTTPQESTNISDPMENTTSVETPVETPLENTTPVENTIMSGPVENTENSGENTGNFGASGNSINTSGNAENSGVSSNFNSGNSSTSGNFNSGNGAETNSRGVSNFAGNSVSGVEASASTHAGQSASSDFQFFTFQSPLNTISESNPPDNSDDDLYHLPNDDQYSDFVPQYELAKDDRLLVQLIGTGTNED